jgi:hypothetical protein
LKAGEDKRASLLYFVIEREYDDIANRFFFVHRRNYVKEDRELVIPVSGGSTVRAGILVRTKKNSDTHQSQKTPKQLRPSVKDCTGGTFSVVTKNDSPPTVEHMDKATVFQEKLSRFSTWESEILLLVWTAL